MLGTLQQVISATTPAPALEITKSAADNTAAILSLKVPF